MSEKDKKQTQKAHESPTEVTPAIKNTTQDKEHSQVTGKNENSQKKTSGGFNEEKLFDASSNIPSGILHNYRIEELLGSGGMGEVYLAFDTRLERYVALKLIKSLDAEMMSRFLIEARAQAKVEHEYVCKIYEVGEYQGRPYIAMQYIDGKILSEAAEEMTLEQKLRIIRQVAEALHVAHREGLIHRDIKPANIMVVRNEFGQWTPFIMDFGLAKEAGAAGVTSTGAVMGTPSYMAPEQARGEINKLDRRTDVYSLGATMYEVLVGRPPFQDESSLKVLMMVVDEDPIPLRKIEPRIPEDVETIVMKCIEKEPQRRYDSAKALADDLQRYLEGEPILARKSTIRYRIAKQAKKHKLVVALSSIMLVVIIVMLVLLVQSRWRASEQARIASLFAQEVEGLEAFVQRSHLLPLHNTSYTKIVVEEKMNWIRANMHRLKTLTEGPGHYALGRGHMAVHQYREARTELELAWNKYKYRNSDVAHALGLTMAELYHDRLEEADRIPNKEMRTLKKKEISELYQKPAIYYIEQSYGSKTAEFEYVGMLLQYLKHDYQAVVNKADELIKRAPWLYEAELIAGDAAHAYANQLRDEGKSKEAAAWYLIAEKKYSSAINIGRSDPSTYERLCALENDVMWMQQYQTGGSIEERFAHAVKVCDEALIADPGSPQSHLQKMLAYIRRGADLVERGGDSRPFILKAVESGKQALMLDPDDEYIYRSLGSAYYNLGYYERMHGLDPILSFHKAIEMLTKAIAINPNYVLAYNALGNTYGLWAEYEFEKKSDPRNSLQKAIENYESGIKVNPQYSAAYNNLGVTYYDKSRYETDHNIDPTNSLEKAIASYKNGIALNPDFVALYNNRANAYLALAEYAKKIRANPYEHIQKSIDDYREAIHLNPGFGMAYANMGGIFAFRAKCEIDENKNPSSSIAEARRYLAKANELYPDDFYTYNNFARTEIATARWEKSQGRPSQHYFEEARRWLLKSNKLNPGNSETLDLLKSI